MDTFDAAKRSKIMAAVRSKNTQPELKVRKALFARGFRYRLHSKDLPGKPDIILKKYRAIIFVHGCFWHGHNCQRGARVPITNREYWTRKIQRNIETDRRAIAYLSEMGWKVYLVWECSLKNESFTSTIDDLVVWLHSNLELHRKPDRKRMSDLD